MKQYRYLLLGAMLATSLTVAADERTDCAASISTKSSIAVKVCGAWLADANANGIPEELASANFDYAKALEISGKQSEATDFYIKSLEEARKSNVDLAIAITSGELGRSHLKGMQFDKSKAALEIAVRYNQKVFGSNHLTTLESIGLLSEVQLRLNDYQAAIDTTTTGLQSIPKSDNLKFVIAPNLYLIRAVSQDKMGDLTNAVPNYVTAAQTMESFDIPASLSIWKRVRFVLLSNGLTSDVSAIDQKIRTLSR